jgi:pimeloyl-ACP methyl ester carboxylesterase
MIWHLDETWETRAGRVAAGRAGQGPALVLAHGWPWSSYCWHRIIPVLARDFTLHWFDMPGYGQSEKRAGEDTSLAAQGQVFCDMLAHWGLSAPQVLAHDVGGAIALRAHLLHGREYAALTLMNVVAMRPWGSAFFDHVGRHVAAFQGLPPHIHAAIVEAYITGALSGGIDPEDLRALVAPWLSPEGQVSFYRQFEQADERYTAEMEPLFASLRCDAQLIWGEEDPWIPLERGRALHHAIGLADWQGIPGAGHLPQLEAPEAVVAAVLRFMARNSG